MCVCVFIVRYGCTMVLCSVPVFRCVRVCMCVVWSGSTMGLCLVPVCEGVGVFYCQVWVHCGALFNAGV